MCGEKFHNAITSAVAVAQAASMTTGIRVQISLRGTNNLNADKDKCVTVYAYDSSHDKMSKIRTLFKYLYPYGVTPEGLSFKSIEKDIKRDAKGDECIFINYSDGEPTDISGCSRSYNGVEYTKKVINGFRELGINIISYFIHSGTIWGSTRQNFKTMYGLDAQFIDTQNMTQVSKTVNAKFLEMAD
jgi:nitric oxide reductase activation protein